MDSAENKRNNELLEFLYDRFIGVNESVNLGSFQNLWPI